MRLPALPEVLLRLLDLYRREDASMTEFAQVIAADPAMAAKVMMVANRAAYRAGGPVADLPRCLEVLGTETVRTIVISQSIYQTMHGLPLLRRVDLGPFWRHSLLAAAVSRAASRHQAGVAADEAYLAGLLHDVGRLALLAAAPEFHAEGLPAEDDAAQCVAERRWLKLDHAEAGAWLIDRWQLGRALSDAVRYHHEPLPRLADAAPLIRSVAFAHLVAEESPDPKLVAEAGQLCKLDMAQISAIAAQARSGLARTAEQLGVDLESSGAPLRASTAAEQLEEEVETLMVATTVLSNQPLQADESRHLLGLADAARLVFQFGEVVVMVPDGADRLCRIGDGGSSEDLPAIDGWREFSLPCGAATRVGKALAARHPLFIDRDGDAAGDLSIAEDQLLRRLSTDQLVVLPTLLRGSGASAAVAALVCAGDRAVLSELAERESFLKAFVARAEAARSRAQQHQREALRLREQQAASALGSARDLVHEINNPLAIVQNYLGLLDARLGSAQALDAGELKELSADIAVLQQEVARVGRLVRTLATPTPPAPSGATDVNRLIADVVRLFKADARAAGIEISAQGNSVAGAPGIDRDQLEQVLVNLVKNAIEAMSTPSALAAARTEGGQVVVANGGLVNRDGQLSLEINVRDNGPGMPGEMLQRLFARNGEEREPPAGGDADSGMARGRGLAIVQQLVRFMGGAILCRSSGSGTSFDILLPYRQPKASESGPLPT